MHPVTAGASIKGRASALAAALLATAAAALASGCGADTTPAEQGQGLADYVNEVEPIRIGVNNLLDKADPVLEGYADGELTAAQAKRRMAAIERGAARYAVRIAAVEDVPGDLQAAHDAYAHTFVLQDTYLSSLVAALPDREFDALPQFQNEQRAAIIAWRTRLQVLADRWQVTLPKDIQDAGRGEISPGPTGA